MILLCEREAHDDDTEAAWTIVYGCLEGHLVDERLCSPCHDWIVNHIKADKLIRLCCKECNQPYADYLSNPIQYGLDGNGFINYLVQHMGYTAERAGQLTFDEASLLIKMHQMWGMVGLWNWR